MQGKVENNCSPIFSVIAEVPSKTNRVIVPKKLK
jgi:hypothetical protein